MRSRLALLAAVVSVVRCKIFDRCELARELSKEEHGIPRRDVATWVCIARHESEYNTSAVGHVDPGGGDHGIFQISDRYWCSPPGVGTACGVGCDVLEDEHLGDDVTCALRIHRAHARRSGDGFSAWAVYRPFCSGDMTQYLRGCDVAEPRTTNVPEAPTTPRPSTTTSAGRGKYPPRKSNAPRKHYKTPTGKAAYDGTVTLPRGNDVSTSITLPRSSQTGLTRPTSSGDLDPSTAWLRVHYDPRFLQ